MAKETALSAEHYQGIGEIVVAWARIETHLVRILRSLTRVSFKEALIVYWQMQYRERLTVLERLVFQIHPDPDNKVRQEFQTLIKRLNTAYGIRNLAGHSVWLSGKAPDSITPLAIGLTGEITPLKQRKDFTAAKLHAEALVIARLGEDIKQHFSANFRVRFIHKRDEAV